MITAIVRFELSTPTSREEMAKRFEETAPTYQDVPGLVRKYDLVAEDSKTAGGVYLWKSKSAAEQFYTPQWKNFIKERYGAEPEISYFDSPVIVDNSLGTIETKDQADYYHSWS